MTTMKTFYHILDINAPKNKAEAFQKVCDLMFVDVASKKHCLKGKLDFSEFADDPDFHFMPVFGDWETNTFYTNRDFMKKAQLFSSEESSILMNLSNDFPTATLIVVD